MYYDIGRCFNLEEKEKIGEFYVLKEKFKISQLFQTGKETREYPVAEAWDKDVGRSPGFWLFFPRASALISCCVL